MKFTEALIAWTPVELVSNPTNGCIRVGPLMASFSDPDWTQPYACTGGAAWVERRRIKNPDTIMRELFEDFHQLTLFYGIRAEDVHKEFLKIDEYRDYFEGMDDPVVTITNKAPQAKTPPVKS